MDVETNKPNPLRNLYNQKYSDEVAAPFELHPNAVSTSRFDDVARLLSTEKGKLLDVGCGAGQFLLALADQFSLLHGIDLSDTRIASARRCLAAYPKYAAKISFQTVDAEHRLPFDDKSFDVVLCCAVLEHVVNVFHVMDEISRVCRKGGVTVITVPNVCYIKHVFSLIGGRVPLTGSPTREILYWKEHGWDGAHLHYFSKSALTDLLAHYGFVPEEWSGDGYLAKIRRWNLNFVGNLTVRARKI